MSARTLTKARSSRPATQVEAVLCVRVSGKQQKEEGFSLEAQLRLLRDYAAGRGILVVQEFVDVESSRVGDRAGFKDMVGYLKKHRNETSAHRVEGAPA